MVGTLSEDVQLYTHLLTADRYYALNDRTIHFLPQCEIDMSATTAQASGSDLAAQGSDGDVVDLLDGETEINIFVVDKNKMRQGGVLF